MNTESDESESHDMKQAFQSSKLLRDVWEEVNELAFAGQLNPPKAIGWMNLSEEESQEPSAVYHPHTRTIAISHKFNKESRFLELCEVVKDPGTSASEKEAAEAEVFKIWELLFRLTLHEAIHQAGHEFDNSPKDHGEVFLKHATGAANQLGIDVPSPEELETWPAIAVLFGK